MFRKKFTLYGRPLILFLYVSGVFSQCLDKLRWNWQRTGKGFLYQPFMLSFLKDAYAALSIKVGIRLALKCPPKFPNLSLHRLWGSNFASRIARAKFIELRWPGGIKRLPMALSAAGTTAWAWRMKAILPVAGLAIFAFWCGLLVREFSVLAPILVRQPMPPAVAISGTDLKRWMDVPRPMIVILPEVVHEPPPVPDPPQPIATPTPSVPKLSVIQIFARLDRGEITVAETKVLLDAKSFVSGLESSRN